VSCESGDGDVEDAFSLFVGAERNTGEPDDESEDVIDGELGVGVPDSWVRARRGSPNSNSASRQVPDSRSSASSSSRLVAM
jgi:hypothetical protein